jgi:hypothetical protein
LSKKPPQALELVRQHQGELELEGTQSIFLAQELARQHDVNELDLERNANCISRWNWCAGKKDLEGIMNC